MNNENYHVFFRRVSTAGQDLAMQESADAIYRDKLLPEEIKIIDEDAVSANKKSLKQRPEMQMLISLIKQNKVHTLYASDRTRLFRDFYEGMEFTELYSKFDVHIVYTSQGNGNIHATDDIFLEGILSMFSGIEGRNIERRTAEVRKRYPPKKFGYVKIKETKKYPKDPVKQDMIEEYFMSLLEISAAEELGELLKEFHKKLGCKYERLVDIARDPFYAAYDLSQCKNKLDHVEPYIDLETFHQIQESISGIIDSYVDGIAKLENLKVYTPICGLCRKPMNYRIDKSNKTGMYTCSHKHSKLTMMAEDLQKIIQLVLHEVIAQLASRLLLNHSTHRFREIKKEIEMDVKAIEHQEHEITKEIILSMNDYSKDWKENAQYKKVSQLKSEKMELLRKLKDINRIYVFHNEIDIEVSKFDYLGEIQSEFIFTGDEIA